MDKKYYKQLSQAYFEAALTDVEERRLKAFLATTDDPDFDEVKAVAGYFATGKTIHGNSRSMAIVVSRFWRVAVAASIAAIFSVSVITTYITHENRRKALSTMESTLTAFFSSGTKVENSIADILNNR